MELVKTNCLMKFFGPVKAVNDVSISLESGKIYGLLGPNGSAGSRGVGDILRRTVRGRSRHGAHSAREGRCCGSRGLGRDRHESVADDE